MTRRKPSENSARTKRPPATTADARENQLIALAVDLAEKQLAEGTASVAVITHYLKLGTIRETMEREKLENEIELLKAKQEGMASAKRVEELYDNAIKSMRTYQGQDEDPDVY